MEEEKKPTQKILEAAGKMVDTYRELLRVNVVEHASLGASWSSVGIFLTILAVFVLLFAGLGSAWWLGERMDNLKAGFFIMSGFYLLVVLAIGLSAKKLIIPGLRNIFIKMMYDKDN